MGEKKKEGKKIWQKKSKHRKGGQLTSHRPEPQTCNRHDKNMGMFTEMYTQQTQGIYVLDSIPQLKLVQRWYFCT